jgi:hypothetical protein
MWPGTADELVRLQHELAAAGAAGLAPSGPRPLVAGCFVCFRRGQRGRGGAGEPGWAAAVLMRADLRQADGAVVSGSAAAAHEPGLMALREGPLLEPACATSTGSGKPRSLGGYACTPGRPSEGCTSTQPLPAKPSWKLSPEPRPMSVLA